MQRGRFVQTAVFYSFIYMANAGILSYLSLFYAEMNISEANIGLLSALNALLATLAGPFWGVCGDRSGVKNRVLQLCLLMSALTVWLLPLAGGQIGPLIAAVCVFFFFHSAIYPMSDAISLELASRERFSFSAVRTIGSIGFMIMSVVIGALIEYDVNYIFGASSLFILLALAALAVMPRVGGARTGKLTIRFWAVLHNRALARMYLYVLILSVGFGFFISFHALYSVERGISTGLLGIGIMLGSVSQLPFMVFFEKLYRRFGIRRIIAVSGLFNVVRWIGYAYWLNPYTVLPLWLLHGATFIVLYLCLAEYVHRHVQKELKVSGQMMNSIVLQGAGRVLGGVLGGFSVALFDYSAVFAVSGAVTLLAVLLFWVTTRATDER